MVYILVHAPVKRGVRNQGIAVPAETGVGSRDGVIGKQANGVALLEGGVRGLHLEGADGGGELYLLPAGQLQGCLFLIAGNQCRCGKDNRQELNISFHLK